VSKWGAGFDVWGFGKPVPPPLSDALPQVPDAAALRRRKILKWLAIIVGGLVLLLALLLIAFRIALSRAPEYRAQVQAWVSERTGLDIQFAKMDARWRFYGPELVFDSAVVRSRDGKRTVVNARRVNLGFDVWTAISTLRLVAGRLTLEQPELQVVRTQVGRIELVGQADLPERDPSVPFQPDAIPTGHLRVIDARVSFRDLKTGRGPWVVPGVSFDLERRGRSMHLEGEAELPATLGRSLRFTADTAGRLAEAGDLQWKFSIDAREWDLAGWTELSPKDWPAPTSGRGSIQLGGIFTGTEVSELSAKVRFDDATLTLPAWHMPIPEVPKLEAYVDIGAHLALSTDDNTNGAADPVAPANVEASVVATAASVPAPAGHSALPPLFEKYQRIAFDLQLARTRSAKGDAWHVRVKDFELSRPNSTWRRSALDVTITRSAQGGIGVTAQSDLLVLDNLWPLLAYAPESPALAHLRALNATGQISELQLEGSRAAPDASLAYTLHARFSGLSVQAIAKAPGVANFSGVIEGGDAGGRLELNVRSGSFDLPRNFRTPLPIERIAGILQWRRDASGLRIDTNELLIDSTDGHARASGEVWIPSDGSSPQANIQAQGWDLVAQAAPRYMPASKLSPKSLQWLDRAFAMGSVQQADFELRGPLQSFPFRGNEGLFLIKARINGLSLDYQPGWIPAKNLVIDAEFRNAGMTATVLQGDVQGLPIVSATGRFIDFKESELELIAEVQGGLDAGLTFVQQSPIGPAIGAQFMALHAEGALQGKVDMRLPLKAIEQQKLSVDVQISEGVVGTKALAQTVRNLKGSLQIRNHALYALDLRGNFLDGPVSIKGGVEGRYTGRGAGLLVQAQGRAAGPAVAQLANLPTSIPLTGVMPWQFSAQVPRRAAGDPAQPTYRIDSDTKGLGIALPEPLGKTADTTRALHFEVDATRENALLLRGAFGDARALIRLQNNDSGWSLDRGGVRVDAVAAALPAHSGLRIEGTIERFVLDDWLKLKTEQPQSHHLADYLRAANVRINSFGFLGFSWPAVRAILQATDDAWRVDVAGEDIAGQLSIPFEMDAGAPLQVALNKLNVGAHESAAAGGGQADHADPRDIPAIAGRVDEFSLSGRQVGVARFVLEKMPLGVKLTTGELRGSSFTATARGSWLATVKGSESTLVVDVASTDVRDTLRAFNYKDLITGKRANGHASLKWAGGIDEELLNRAIGKVRIEMFDGQLLNVDPGGAGRMMGLLSVSALPRRLALDFSDVTDKGISFDTVYADFDLKDGDAYTTNLLLSGPQAEVGIVGRTGLRAHDYDLTAVGAGDIGGSLSVASTVVGGPVVGAAVLAFTRLFKQPLKGVTRRYYHIGGSWENPTVERIDKEVAEQDTAQVDAAVIESSAEQAEGLAAGTPDDSAPDKK
jgi:uncharacterized protein (TIGR02099 family)